MQHFLSVFFAERAISPTNTESSYASPGARPRLRVDVVVIIAALIGRGPIVRTDALLARPFFVFPASSPTGTTIKLLQQLVGINFCSLYIKFKSDRVFDGLGKSVCIDSSGNSRLG